MTRPAAADVLPPFPSFELMRSSHTALLRLYREAGGSPALLDQAERFVRSGAATGATLEDDDDRMSAQSLLDYWAAVLSRAERPPSNAFLEPFDPELAPELPDDLCPYVGLEAFGESKRKLFFGREQVVKDVLDRVGERRFLAVVGPLASGKSSLVLGAVLPALKAGRLPGSDKWRFYPVLTPGFDPLANLARAVGAPGADGESLQPADVVRAVDAGGEQPAVIVVDRLEEIFTRCSSADARDAFATALLGVVESPGQHRVIVTLRSDFEAQIAAIPQAQARFTESVYRLPPLSAGELRDVICRPAAQVGLKFEAGLVDRLVRETLGDPTGLPLLQFTLLKLWDFRERNRLTNAAYDRMGGGRRALAHTADELYEGLDSTDRETLRTIMLMMVRPAMGADVVTASVRPETAYARADRASVDRVIGRLVAARLAREVRAQDPRERAFELAHDALVWNWPRLVEWLDEERVSRRRRLRLTAAAEQWNLHGSDPGGLLGGSLLEEAKAYTDLSPLEQTFVEASVAAAAAAAAQEERARNRDLEQARQLAAEQQRRADEQAQAAGELRRKNGMLVSLVAAVIVVLVIAVIGWVAAERARNEAVRKQQTVEALMAGQGVVLEEATPTDSAAAPPPPTTAAPVRPPAVAIPPAAGVAVPVPNVARPSPSLATPTPNVPSPSPDTAPRAATAVLDGERLLAQVRLRASRQPTGRQIAGTELPAYEFAIWAEGPPEAMQAIERVEYEFNHPTFQQKLQVSRARNTGFRVGYTGWGCLSSVAVTFRLRTAATTSHVDFDMCEAIASAASAN